ncbi:MAG: bacteriohemerythrin [Burkholderiales bacterium]|nr:bacteriohemerythrin [Burkholderiales bacterium]
MKTMEWIHWDNVLATGHAILDIDHQRLADLFNRLASVVKERKGKAACVELLDDIIHHAQVHFAFEEQLMSEQNYPKADQHAAEHFQLTKQAIRFMAKFQAESAGSHIPLIHFPEDWLTRHIFTADKELAVFLFATD